MSELSAIPIIQEPPAGSDLTGNLAPVLSEIREALAIYVASGEASSIDLRAMPFGPGDETALFRILGTGEISAELSALGLSRIWESRFPGVWVVDHANEQGDRLALHIEITDLPALLRSQPEDIRESLVALDRHLESLANLEVER